MADTQLSLTASMESQVHASELSDALRRLSFDTSASDRLSTILHGMISQEDFTEAALEQLAATVLEHRRLKGCTNNKCVRSMCYAARQRTDRLVLVTPLISRLITLDEQNNRRNGSTFLRSQRNLLACMERLYATNAFVSEKAACLPQILYNLLRDGSLEANVVLKWLRRTQPLTTEVPPSSFGSLKQHLHSFQGWLECTLDTDEEEL